MPVIPTGIPAYQIRPPLTTGDKGEPSTGESSILTDTRRIFDLIEDERHLTAHALLVSVQKRLEEWSNTTHHHEQQQDDHINNIKTSGALMILPPGLAKQLAKFTTPTTPTPSSSHHPFSGNNSSIDDNSSVLSLTDPQLHHQHQHYAAAQEMLQSRHEQIAKLEVSDSP
jgi:hypothetical protein